MRKLCVWKMVCMLAVFCAVAPTPSTAQASSYPVQLKPVTPCRLVDTRTQYGGSGPVQGGTFATFSLAQIATKKGCADLSTAVAYSLNVTVVPQVPLGYLTVWPTGESQPGVSTLNSVDGRVKANAAIVPAGTNGAINVFASNTTDLVLDIDGYFAAADGSTLTFYALPPCRVADTRNANGDLGGPYLTGQVPRDFPVLKSSCFPTGINPAAYSFNMTAVPHVPLGYLTVWPKGQKQPNVSTLNALTGTVVANAAIVPAGADGTISTFASNDSDLVIDVNGYFAATGGNNPLSLYPVTPCRVLDTRNGNGAFVGELTLDIVDSVCAPPSSAQAYVFNATVVPSEPLGYLTLWPTGGSEPLVSTLNAVDGVVTSNMAIVPTTNGWVNAFASNTTQLVMDIFAYFAPITPTIVTTLLPDGILNSPYSAMLQAVDGYPPYTWSLTAGNLPMGLSLDSSSGLIFGKPTATGTSNFTVQVKDTQSQTASANLSITIQQAPPLYITTSYLSDGTQGVPYNASLMAAGGVLPYTWSILTGSLPAGLVLATDGTISGTPQSTGTASFTVQVTDFESPPQSATANLSLTIDPNLPPTLSSISPSSGPAGSGAFTLQLYGSGFNLGSIVQWNGAPRATTYVSSYQLTAMILASDVQPLGNVMVTVYNPPPGGGLSAPQIYSTYLALPTNDLLYNPVTQLLYASVPSAAGPSLGNSVVSIDPATGVLGTPIWVGSEPTKMALSSDGTTLWVGLNGAGAVRKVDLTTGQPGVQFSLGGVTGVYDPPSVAASLAVMPGHPNTVAVSAFQFPNGATAIFDNGVQRAQTSNVAFNAMIFSPSGSEIYGAAGNYNSGYYVLTVDSTGITSSAEKNSNISSSDIRYDSGRVYLTNGEVLDAEQGTLLGTFFQSQNQPATGPVAVDSAIGGAWILEGGYSSNLIGAYDLSTFALKGTIGVSVPNGNGTPTSLVRWGQDGLAFRTGLQVYALRSTLVRDLSKMLADVGVTATGPASGATGTNLAYNLTITNNGPNPASPVVLTDTIPQGTVFSSATTSQGYCSGSYIVVCNLGTLANNGSATVTINVAALLAGSVQNTAQVNAAQGDPNPSNNTAATSTVISGAPYNPVPALSGISPSFVQAGTSSFTLTLSGSQFTSTSQVLWNGTALPTTYDSANQLTAQIDSSLVASMGWAWITVFNPTPGGGFSASQPITTYGLVNLDTNHLVFDPFTRQLYASVPGTAPQLQGNSIVSIDPNTGALGSPVNIGSEPNSLAESDDGVWLYTLLTGAQSLARYNLGSGLADPTKYALNPPGGGSPSLRALAVLPGSENTLAIDLGSWLGNGIFDISNGTGAFRSKLTGPYSGSSLTFPDANHLYTHDSDTTGNEFYRWNVTADGLTSIDGSTLNGMGRFKLSSGLVYAAAGGFADPTPTPPKQLAQYQVGQALGSNGSVQGVDVAPDPALDRVFFLASNFFGSNPVLLSYDQSRYELLNLSQFPQNTAGPDLVRWGKDGLAFQEGLGFGQGPGSGRIVLLRGAFVLPTWGSMNPTPGLTSVSPSSAQAGGSNFYLTATGSNFVPGAVLLWNGSERTTAYLDPAHLRVAIPEADIAKPGTATLTVVNPGSAPSGGISFPIN